MSATRKRFIAGAVCPSCSAMDTLAVWREDRHHQRQTEQQVEKHVRPQEQVIGIFQPK